MAEEIQIQSDNHIYYFKTFDDFEAHKDEILNNSQIFVGESSGGSLIGGTETLLWENQNPNQNFEYQSIHLIGLMEYDYLVITSKMLLGGTGADEYQNTTLIKVEIGSGGTIISNLYNTNTRCRNVVIEEDNTIYLSDAFIENTNQIFNNHCIPLEIYGIKIDSSSSTQSNQNIYSLEEVVIGTYLDKPLYRKLIPVPGAYNINKGSEQAVSVNQSDLPTDVDRYIHGECITYDYGSSLTKGMFGGILVKGVNYNNSIIWLYNEAIGSYIEITANTSYVALEYTKTTD